MSTPTTASTEFSISEFSKTTGMSQAEVKRTLADLPPAASFSLVAAALTNAAVSNVKSTGSVNRVSTSELARLTGLDRATVAKRLEGLEPIQGKRNAALYELHAALPALLLEAADVDDIKLRKLRAETGLKEKELANLNGETCTMAEVVEAVSAIFGAVYEEFAVQYPIEASARLARAKNATAVALILRNDGARKFKRLRDDYTEFLK